jgi:hypothetical protein
MLFGLFQSFEQIFEPFVVGNHLKLTTKSLGAFALGQPAPCVFACSHRPSEAGSKCVEPPGFLLVPNYLKSHRFQKRFAIWQCRRKLLTSPAYRYGYWRLRDQMCSRWNLTWEVIMGRPLRNFIYATDDWTLMQGALLKASRRLHRGPSDKYADRLARRVMTLFDQGLRDENVIASAAVRQERLIARMLSLRQGRGNT